MKRIRIACNSLSAALILALACCGGTADRAKPTAQVESTADGAYAEPASAPGIAATPSVVPDLASPNRWTKTTDGKILVTPDNFVRAESDL
jgi:hypothetical protein